MSYTRQPTEPTSQPRQTRHRAKQYMEMHRDMHDAHGYIGKGHTPPGSGQEHRYACGARQPGYCRTFVSSPLWCCRYVTVYSQEWNTSQGTMYAGDIPSDTYRAR
jgi:hypothetical protein